MKGYSYKYIFFSLFLMIILNSCGSDNDIEKGFDDTKLDNYLDELNENQEIMGSVAIMEKDKIVYARAFGMADIENNILATTETKYRVGSVTKTFTAVLILMAIEEEKLSLEQTLNEFYPSVVNADKITISDLLYHRTGIPDITNDEDYMSWYIFPKTKDELLQHISAYDSDFLPGSQLEYSNSNYILLTFILEKLYGKEYKDILHEKVLNPVRLLNTDVGAKIDITKNEAYSYSYSDEWIKEAETDMSIPLGAGYMISTPTDINQFIYNVFNGTLLSGKSLTQMVTLKDEMGIGITPLEIDRYSGWAFLGGIDGFVCLYFYVPEQESYITCCFNAFNQDSDEVAIKILQLYFEQK